jgi:hypothetical protein
VDRFYTRREVADHTSASALGPWTAGGQTSASPCAGSTSPSAKCSLPRPSCAPSRNGERLESTSPNSAPRAEAQASDHLHGDHASHRAQPSIAFLRGAMGLGAPMPRRTLMPKPTLGVLYALQAVLFLLLVLLFRP